MTQSFRNRHTSGIQPHRLARALRLAWAGAAGLMAAPGVMAQAGAAAPDTAPLPQAHEAQPSLPTVRVQGNRDKGLVVRRGSTATKTDTPLNEVAQSLHVITAREMEDMGMTTLTEAVRQTPGVTVNPYGSDSRAPDWVILRGFDGWYTSSYRDGLIQTVGLTFLGQQTEVYGLERLEVLLGPSSVLFGKGDVGGVVNRVSKVPEAGMVREVEVQAGSYGRRQLNADLGGALTGDGRLRWRLVGLKLDTGTQEKYPGGQRMERDREYLAPSLRWDITPQSSLILQYEHLQDDADDDIQYVTGPDGQPTSIKEGDPRYSRIKTGSDAGGYQFEHQFEGGWRLSHKLRQARRTMDKHHVLSFLNADGTQLERDARHDVESVKETTVDTSLQGAVRTGPLTHGLLFGLDWDRSRARWQRWSDPTVPLDMADPVYGVDIAEPTTPAGDLAVTTTQLGVYAQDQLKWDERWRLTLGLRHDRVKTRSEDRLFASEATQNDNATTGRIGLNYLLGNGWAPYVSYAESFVPNVGSDSAGNAFVPSDGRQVEVGVKYLPQDQPFSFTAAFFNLKKTNVVGYDPEADYTARQIGTVRSRGLELSAKAELTRQWRLTAAYTTIDLKVLASANAAEVGKTPMLVPEQTGNLWLEYSFDGGLSGLAVSAGLRYVGKRWNDEINSSSEPAYTLADAGMRYSTGPWRFALNVSNLFNRHYYSSVAYGSYFRGEDRAVLLSAKYRF